MHGQSKAIRLNHGSGGLTGFLRTSTPKLANPDHPRRTGIPAGIWALGFVSMFMDISSEMIHALLPAYLVVAMGASTLAVGVIEGIAEATASIVKVFSGAISDWLGKRKALAVLGYGMAALTKPIFPLASTLGWIVTARFLDRVGKGIRGAPRDALVADLAPPHLSGASFGLRQTLDTIGAFTGPLLAIALMWATADDFQSVFWIAVVPAFLSVILLIAFVKEPPRAASAKPAKAPFRRSEIGRLTAVYWLVVAVAAVFTLARFSEAFLILRAQSAGLPLTLLPMVLVVMNIAYAVSAYPAGVLADRTDRTTLLLVGLALLAGADLFLAYAPSLAVSTLGIALWGLHMGFTQGVFAAMVADTAPSDLRGTAFGVFNLVSGLALLAASVIAGALWQYIGPQATFVAGAVFAVLAAISIMPLRARLRQNHSW
jgi:MFS family permease